MQIRFLSMSLLAGFTFLTCRSLSAQQPQSPLVDSFKSYQQMKSETEFGLQWVSLGPVVNGARVEAVQLDPLRPGTIYVAFGSGNLWKTTNNGVTWKPIFENQASHGIGDVAIAPSDANIIYVGTGESLKKGRNFTIPGTGIYRSGDGGETWKNIGLADSWHIGEIAVHPTNPNIVLVAVQGHFWSSNPHRGLYRTENGGKTWQHVLKIDEKTGANDVVWAHSNPKVAYASTWENYPDVCGANSGVYRTEDAGLTWQKCDQGLPSGEKVGRIGVAVSHSDSNKVYALVDNREHIDKGAAAEIYRSFDGGKTWNRTHQSDLQFFSRIGWYFADIYVSPNNDDEVFALGVRLAHSSDGGRNFEYIGGQVTHVTPSAASGLHLDQCELWINPTNPDHLALGNDGGLYQSFDKGQSWVHFNNLPTGEFYDIEVDQDRDDYRIFAGAQDDATVFGTAREHDPLQPSDWKYLWIDPWNGGDGCISLVDPEDPDTVYFSAQEGAFRRKTMSTNRSVPIRPRLPKSLKEQGKQLNFNFVAPMIISPHDSNRLFLGGNFLFTSENRGEDWSPISPDLSKKSGEAHSLAISSIAESTLQQGLIYAGTDRGLFWVKDNAGKSWTDASGGLPSGYIRSIAPSRFQAARVYVAMSGLNYDDFNSYLFCSEDAGKSWTDLSANLPNEPCNVVVEDPVYEFVLYAGTFRGVYISINRGESWSLLGSNLPACSIADLEVQRVKKDLVIATHGRGIYRINLEPIYELIEQRNLKDTEACLFKIPDFELPYLSDTRPGLNFRKVRKQPISFWLSKPGTIKLSILPFRKVSKASDDALGDNELGDNKLGDNELRNNQQGDDEANRQSPNSLHSKATAEEEKAIVSFELSCHKGLNQFRWDLQIESTDSSQPYFINYKKYLKPGNYRIQLQTADGSTAEQSMKVVKSKAK